MKATATNNSERNSRVLNSYAARKAAAREKAIDWQYWAADQNLSYYELAEWCDYFEALGRRYGLLREFRENCII